MSETVKARTTHTPECTDCGKKPTLENRELVGLVVSCDCETMSVRVASLLPEGWQ